MAPAEGPPLSLRPFPVTEKKPSNLAEFIARVNSQPGGFRAVTEEKLREEIRAREESSNEVVNEEDVDMSDGAGADDDEDGAAKDPNLARIEVLRNIDVASNAAMLTLDSLSLLLSKQSPTQAGLTLSQQLREMVGIGTIGADKLHDSNATPDKTKQKEEVALGWTLMEINKTRDAAEDASAFLEREMESEGRYWEDIMAVKKAGWSICKVPQERHTLGVRFGFSEAAPEFKNNGLAPMRRSDDGSVTLDCGKLGGVSERLVVTYEKDGKVVGRSTPPARVGGNVSLESRVLEARNTIFAQELWHELSRESRTLTAYDVRLRDSQLTCAIDSSTKVTLELLPLESCASVADSGLPENAAADAISIALHMLLSYSHRYNELMRIRPIPPHITRARGQPVHALLRPIIARMMSIRCIKSCTNYVGALAKSLKAAGLPASFTLHTPQASLELGPGARGGPNQLSSSQTLIRNMLQPLDFTIKLAVLPETSFTIRGRTFLFPVTTTYYNILLPPTSPLQKLCAPYSEGYPSLKALADYMRTAVARLLTDHYLTKLTSASSSTADRKNWMQSLQGTSIHDSDKEQLDLRFAVENQDDETPALVVTSETRVDNKPERKRWRWDSSAQAETATLDDVVDQVVASTAS